MSSRGLSAVAELAKFSRKESLPLSLLSRDDDAQNVTSYLLLSSLD